MHPIIYAPIYPSINPTIHPSHKPSKDRGHATKLHDASSRVAAINASITQGSVVGPASYVIVASDLHTKNPANKMSKYADDTYLMVGSNNIDTISEDFANHYSLLGHAQQSKNPS